MDGSSQSQPEKIRGTCSLEYKLIQANFDRLVNSIQPVVAAVARKAFEKNMIAKQTMNMAQRSSVDDEQKANVVMAEILDKVEDSQNSFHALISILQEIPLLKHLTDKLAMELDFSLNSVITSSKVAQSETVHESKSISKIRDSVGSFYWDTAVQALPVHGDQTDYTEHRKCSLSYSFDKEAQCSTFCHEASISHQTDTSHPEQRDDPFQCPCGRCSLDTYFIKGGCDMKERQRQERQFPYLDTEGLSEEDREDLEAMLAADAKKMVKIFALLICSTRTSLEKQGLSPDKVAQSILCLGAFDSEVIHKPLLVEHKSNLLGADSISKIFSILLVNQYVSFFNYEILEHVISDLGTADNQENLQQYLTKFSAFCKRNVFEVPPNIFGRMQETQSKRKLFVVKLTPQTHKLTLTDVLLSRRKVAEVIGLKSSTLYLSCIRTGCVELSFLLPSMISESVFPLSSLQLSQLSENDITIPVALGKNDPNANLKRSEYASVISANNSINIIGEPEAYTSIYTCEKPERMRDWLIRMINSNRFSDLEWIDEEKTVFRVPWLHAKKRGNRSGDVALFREWAIYSGKYRADSDPIVWKINFRCAINGLKDVMEIKDMQTEDYRVYKMLPSCTRRLRRRARNNPYPKVSLATSNSSLAPYTFGGQVYPSLMSERFSAFVRQDSPDSGFGSSLAPHIFDDQVWPTLISELSACVRQDSPDSGIESTDPSPACQTSPLVIQQQDCTTNELKVLEHTNDVEDNPPIPPSFPTCDLRFQIFYGSIAVHYETLDCSMGCRILSDDRPKSSQMKNNFSLPAVHEIILPEIHPHQQSQEIFRAMQEGVIVEASEGDIYVTPMCRVVIYCASSPTEQSQPLKRKERTKVFDYNNFFCPALEKYAFYCGQSLPNPYIILGLGESWGSNRPVTENLISVVITNVKASREIDIMFGLSATSLTNVHQLNLPEPLNVKEPHVENEMTKKEDPKVNTCNTSIHQKPVEVEQ